MKIAQEFDEAFDSGEDISAFLDYSRAKRLGVARQAIMKLFLAQHLEKVG